MVYKSIFSFLKNHVKYVITRRKYNYKRGNNKNDSPYLKERALSFKYKKPHQFLNKKYLFSNIRLIDKDSNRLSLHEWINNKLRKEILSNPEESQKKLRKFNHESVDTMHIEPDKNTSKSSPPF